MLLQKNCATNFITFYLNVNNVKLSPSMTVTVQGVHRLQSTTITTLCLKKKWGTHIIPHNSSKCGPILIILSL